MNIPEGMPVLSTGAHAGPAGGACVMEMVSYLAGEKWSDEPACTHRTLSRIAQQVNDSLSDTNRHKILPFISRLMNTGDVDNEVIDQAIAEMTDGRPTPRIHMSAFDPYIDLTSRMALRFNNWQIEELDRYYCKVAADARGCSGGDDRIVVDAASTRLGRFLSSSGRDLGDAADNILLKNFDKLLCLIEAVTEHQPVPFEDRIPELVELTTKEYA